MGRYHVGIRHTKNFGVYYWDTFDGEIYLKAEFDTRDEAEAYIKDRYKDHLRPDGADKVEIVNERGNIVAHFSVG